MEKRKIIVVSSATQSQAAFESEAETLGQLKQELDSRGISYAGMTFLEGHSKLEMNLDDAILPTNIPYKGSTTNDLVFLLTSPQKKIKSGSVSRVELYGFIRDNDLADAIKEKFGKNFTNVSTESLSDFLKLFFEHLDNCDEEDKKEEDCKCNSENTSVSWDFSEEENSEDNDDSDETDAIDAMVDGLKHIIYGMVRLGYINPVDITKPNEHKILSDAQMKELFGDFFNAE